MVSEWPNVRLEVTMSGKLGLLSSQSLGRSSAVKGGRGLDVGKECLLE